MPVMTFWNCSDVEDPRRVHGQTDLPLKMQEFPSRRNKEGVWTPLTYCRGTLCKGPKHNS